MESWQKQHIEQFLAILAYTTKCSEPLMNTLTSSGLIDENGVSQLKSMENGNAQALKMLQLVITTRKANAFNKLREMLENDKQLIPFIILSRKRGKEALKTVGKLTYDKKTILGNGQMGSTVYLGKFGEKPVAIKKLDNHIYPKRLTLRVVEILGKHFGHPNIVKMYHVEYVAENYIYIALELCDITLEQSVKSLKHLHKNKIIHRDLKPANVLFSLDGEVFVKLADFGLSKTIDPERSSATATVLGGTECWTPPELLSYVDHKGPKDGNKFKQTVASDIFPLGCLAYYLLTDGKHPFGQGYRVPVDILDNRFSLVDLKGVHSIEYERIITSMITKDPTMRPTVSEFLMILEMLEERSYFLETVVSDHIIYTAPKEASAQSTNHTNGFSDEQSDSYNRSFKNTVIGIDIGTSTCVVSLRYGERTEMIEFDQELPYTSSYVYVEENGELISGCWTDCWPDFDRKEHTIVDCMHLIACTPEELTTYVTRAKVKRFCNALTSTEGIMFKVRETLFSPSKVLQMLFEFCKSQAEQQSGLRVANAVLTVPAYYNHAQRAVVRTAAVNANLVVQDLLLQPVAVGIAHLLSYNINTKTHIIVCDFGGGKFESSVLELEGTSVRIISSAADPMVGGDDIDEAMAEYCLSEFAMKNNLSARSMSLIYETEQYYDLLSECRSAKVALSKSEEVRIHVRSFQAEADLYCYITRDNFNVLLSSFVQKILNVVDDTLKAAKSQNQLHDPINELILVGGSTNIPFVRSSIKNFIGENLVTRFPDVLKTVAFGAVQTVKQLH